MEITGKLIQKLPLQTGVGRNGNWQKLDFIIETIEQYPKKICANVWGDRVDLVNRINIGDTVIMSFSLESREFNGRWYTDVRAWKIEVPSVPTNRPTDADQPAAQAPTAYQQQPAVKAETAAPFEGFSNNSAAPEEEINDDLPF